MKDILNDSYTIELLCILSVGGFSIMWDAPSMIITMIGVIWVLKLPGE